MLTIFICYSREQKEIRNIIKDSLKTTGYETKFDEKDVTTGELDWRSKIKSLIIESDIFLLLWSEKSCNSVIVETEIAIAIGNKIKIIPVALDSTPLPDEEEISYIQKVNFTERGAIIKLHKSLKDFEEGKKKYGKIPSATILSQFVNVPSGEFTFSKTNKLEKVKEFEISKFLVTISQYSEYRPSGFSEMSRRENLPINNISWFEARAYCSWLSELSKTPIKLPSELEWEYAAKAGKNFEFATKNGKINKSLVNYNNLNTNNYETTPMEQFPPNPFKIFDMTGNLWEWCEDFDDKYMNYCIVKGGSFLDCAYLCRNTSKYFMSPATSNILTGFRVMRVAN